MTGDSDSATDLEAPPSVLLIVPCYNEEHSIAGLLEEIRHLSKGFDTLVIDDGSTDGTYTEAVQHSRCIRHIENLGIGGAVQSGIIFANRHGYELCVQLDGDGQHPPGEVAKLVAAYRQGPTNIVVGTRYSSRRHFQSTWLRRLGSQLIGLTLRLAFGGVRISDPTSGLRLFDRRAIRFFARDYPHDFPEPISLARALRRGLTLSEAPVTMRPRQHGTSTIDGVRSLSYMIRVISYMILARLQPVPPASE